MLHSWRVITHITWTSGIYWGFIVIVLADGPANGTGEGVVDLPLAELPKTHLTHRHVPATLVYHLRLLVETQLALPLLVVGVLVGTPLLLLLVLLLLLLYHIIYLARLRAHRILTLQIIVEDSARTVVILYLLLTVQTEVIKLWYCSLMW